MSGPKKVYFKGLGCPKNEVDGDIILGYLQKKGLLIVETPEAADYLLVNTCSFIQSAKEESIEEIFKLVAAKNGNGGTKRLLVSGCLAQRYPNELLAQIPEIDGMVGIDQYEKIDSILDVDAAYITRPPSLYKESHDIQLLRQRPFAYLKIADGCDSRCSYCAIPMMRGNFRSRSLDAISREVDRLLASGVVELNLIAQDVAYYGYDINQQPLDLLKMLESRSEWFWVRPFYLHPRHVSDEILSFFASSSKFCGYFESPIQHISSRLLKRMNRGYDRSHVENMVDRISLKLPKTVWRTTFIVGFPGETEKEFDELCSFVVDRGINRAGVFGYSHEEGTPSYRYRALHSQKTISARAEELTRLINENAEEFNLSLVGAELDMIVEEFDSDQKSAVGRLFCDAPEIDFSIRVQTPSLRTPGLHRVRVTGATPEGFTGKFVAKDSDTLKAFAV